MAQKVQVLLVCDLHDDEVQGSESVTFGLDGQSYEIDLCEEHAEALHDAFAPYVGAARRGGRAAASPRRAGAGRASAPRSGGASDSGAVRAWAKENGYEVSERGRISGQVLAAYEAAH